MQIAGFFLHNENHLVIYHIYIYFIGVRPSKLERVDDAACAEVAERDPPPERPAETHQKRERSLGRGRTRKSFGEN